MSASCTLGNIHENSLLIGVKFESLDLAPGNQAGLAPQVMQPVLVYDYCWAGDAPSVKHRLSQRSSDTPRHFASPPCMAAEVDPTYFDPSHVDPEQARDVARWRKAERQRLRGERDAMSVADRASMGERIGAHLLRFLADRFGSLEGRVFSGYWPIKGEPDLRPVLASLHRAGVSVALPLVEEER